MTSHSMCHQCQCRRHWRNGFDPCVRKIPWRRKWQSTPVFLPGESHGQRSLLGYSIYSFKGSDTTERLSMHTAQCWLLAQSLSFLSCQPFYRAAHMSVGHDSGLLKNEKSKRKQVTDLSLL